MRTPRPIDLPALLAAALSVVGMAGACSRPAHPAADLVVTNANVWTGNPLQPQAMAVATAGARIVHVGDAAATERWRGPNKTVTDAEGRRVNASFNDADVHFVDGG